MSVKPMPAILGIARVLCVRASIDMHTDHGPIEPRTIRALSETPPETNTVDKVNQMEPRAGLF